MSISGISGLAHHIPQTHQAKVDDENKEALAIKVKEMQAGKDLAVQVGFLKPDVQSKMY